MCKMGDLPVICHENLKENQKEAVHCDILKTETAIQIKSQTLQTVTALTHIPQW